MIERTIALFLWQPHDELKRYLCNGVEMAKNIRLIFPEDSEQKTLLKYASQAQIIVGWRPTKELLLAATNLSLYINPGAGVQHLIVLFREINKTRKIILVNGHGNTYFAAQHAVALLLALMNKVITHHNWMTAGEWRKGDDDAISIPLRTRTIGLLGYGAVNQKVHKFLMGFDVTFAILRRDWQIHRPLISEQVRKFTREELDAFFEYCDIIIVAVPLTSRTKGLVEEKHLKNLGKDGLLVNIARGDVIREESLFNALKNKTIAGAALDVWYEYRPEADEYGKKYPYHFPFHELDNVVLSPHRAASPFSDLKRWDEVIENIQRFARGERDFLNSVDLKREY